MVLADPQTPVCIWTLEVHVCACTSDHPSLPADKEKGICVCLRVCVCIFVCVCACLSQGHVFCDTAD